MSTTAIILAADSNESFPGPHYLASLRDKPLLQHVVDDATTWPVDDVIVVLGPDADEILASIDFGKMAVIIDPEWSEGSASPLRAGLDLVSRDRAVRRCVIASGDQPGVDAETVAALVEAITDPDVDAVVPKYRYAVGTPAVLEKSLWDHLLGAEGSIDVLDVIVSHATNAQEVWFDRLAPRTYRTPDDLPTARR